MEQQASAFAAPEATGGSSSLSNNESDGLPRLPVPDPNRTEDIPVLKLGETISFEEMGPIILNSDGTTRRISNWDQMTKQEQEATWRRIKKRNEERRKKLLLEQEEAKAKDTGSEAEL